jgi:phage-related protein
VTWEIVYYTDARDRNLAQEEFDALPLALQSALGVKLELLEQHGIKLPRPHARYLGDGLWELRAQAEGAICRGIYFTWTGRRFVLLSVFQKKTQKTPPGELEQARRRRKDWLERHKEKP